MDVSTVGTRKALLPVLVAWLAAGTALAQDVSVGIDLDPTTPLVLDSALALPGPVASIDVAVSVLATGRGVREAKRIAFGATNGFNLGGATVIGITPLATFNVIPGLPGAGFLGAGGEFQFGSALGEPAGTAPFVGGPALWAVFRLHFGVLPAGSQVRVFVGDRGPGTGAVTDGAGADISGDATADGTPLFGTAAFDEGAGAGIDYRDAVITFGQPPPCTQSPAPECGGTCPRGESCQPNPFTAECGCLPDPLSCGQVQTPECDGECPPGQMCRPAATGDVCFCEDVPACADTAPQCDGPCPVGEACVPDPDGSGACICQAPEPPCGQSFPACSGDCPAGSICTTTPIACVCQPIATPCADALGPECNGACPPDQQCRVDVTTNACFCAPADVPCADAKAPECAGRCTLDTQICVPGTTGLGCFCADVPCDLSPFPECGGSCPPGSSCRVDAAGGACVCAPDIVPCGQSPYPECDGVCPEPTDVCDVVPGAVACECRPASLPCSLSAPLCGGDCPEGEVCLPGGAQGCFCAPPPNDCGNSPFPECTGNCPDGSTCRPQFGADRCACEPAPPSCQDSPAPECNGVCPSGSFCAVSAAADACDCRPCDPVPPREVQNLLFRDDHTLVWDPVLCADYYNVYRATYKRLPDMDNNGVADDYGMCLYSAVPTTMVVDMDVPALGVIHHYLTTAENIFGEGTMGMTGGGVTRPNLTPCP
jgi:hypothetical protein